jgi:hypothetical protein
MSNVKARLTKLEGKTPTKKAMTWRQLMETENLEELPADQQEKWETFIEGKHLEDLKRPDEQDFPLP